MINTTFIPSFVKSTERGAYGASTFKGKNDKIAADQAAVDAMRRMLGDLDINGTVYTIPESQAEFSNFGL